MSLQLRSFISLCGDLDGIRHIVVQAQARLNSHLADALQRRNPDNVRKGLLHSTCAHAHAQPHANTERFSKLFVSCLLAFSITSCKGTARTQKDVSMHEAQAAFQKFHNGQKNCMYRIRRLLRFDAYKYPSQDNPFVVKIRLAVQKVVHQEIVKG